MPASISTYLFFSGRCDEALQFYTQALGAKVEMVMRFNESPDPVPEGMLQAGFENKIMHASFCIGETRVMASDGCDDKSKFDGFRMVFTASSEAEAHQAFNALADGGTVQMPLCKTFWSPCYGMVTDKFNVGWMVMVPGDHP
jgi:PhnB protein